MLLVLDNYDSFTYNLVQYFGELGQQVEVLRNDALSPAELCARTPDYLVISPGPCTPNEAGLSLQAVEHFAGRVPILGVCLGHQAIVQALGGRVVQAKQLMHGKTSPIQHRKAGLFAGLPNPFTATRYHSLAVEADSLPEVLETHAWTEDGEIMAVKHRDWPVYGVQFHPESIATEHGHALLEAFLKHSDAK